MIKTNKFIVFFLVGLMVFSAVGFTVFASGTESNYEFEEIDLPQGLISEKYMLTCTILTVYSIRKFPLRPLLHL